jgi:hypothetical protein
MKKRIWRFTRNDDTRCKKAVIVSLVTSLLLQSIHWTLL